jgi:hypothetical protein
MLLTIERPAGSSTINLAHVSGWTYRAADGTGPSALTIDGRGRDQFMYQGADADAVHATLSELLGSGKVAAFRCKLPPRGGQA